MVSGHSLQKDWLQDVYKRQMRDIVALVDVEYLNVPSVAQNPIPEVEEKSDTVYSRKISKQLDTIPFEAVIELSLIHI